MAVINALTLIVRVAGSPSPTPIENQLALPLCQITLQNFENRFHDTDVRVRCLWAIAVGQRWSWECISSLSIIDHHCPSFTTNIHHGAPRHPQPRSSFRGLLSWLGPGAQRCMDLALRLALLGIWNFPLDGWANHEAVRIPRLLGTGYTGDHTRNIP